MPSNLERSSARSANRIVILVVASCLSAFLACSSSDAGPYSGGDGGANPAGGRGGDAQIGEGGASGAAGAPTDESGAGAAGEADMAVGGAAGAMNDGPGTPGAAGAGGDSDAPPPDCGTGAGVVDQEQLVSDSNLALSATQFPGQTFTVGTTGILTGLEFGLANCGGPDPDARVALTLSRAGKTVAKTSIPVTQISIATCAGPIALSGSLVGGGFFDLSAHCVAVTAGDTLTVKLSVIDSLANCSADYVCEGGPKSGSDCNDDSDCAYSARAGLNSSDGYANGNALVGNNPQSGSDLSFKSFVR